MNDIRKYCLEDVIRIVNYDFTIDEELQLLQYLINKYDFIEVIDYVKETEMNDKTVRNRVESGKIPSFKIANTNFIIKKLL